MTSSSEEKNLWVRRYVPETDAPVRLACFPHAGGSASYFLPLARALAPAVDVLAIQYPGRQDRYGEPCIDSVTGLADAAIEELLIWADRPLALFGHSLGAAVAFEVARRLEDRGMTLPTLFISGRRAPSLNREETIHLCDDDGLVAEVQRLSGGLSRVLDDPEVRELVLPSIRSDYKAAETYRWTGGAPLTAPIHVNIGDSDPRVSLDEARPWDQHTTGSCEIEVHPGGHFYLGEQTDRLAASITSVLTPA